MKVTWSKKFNFNLLIKEKNMKINNLTRHKNTGLKINSNFLWITNHKLKLCELITNF